MSMDAQRLARLKLLAERAALDRCADWGDPEVWRGLADTHELDFDVALYLAASRPETVLLLLADRDREVERLGETAFKLSVMTADRDRLQEFHARARAEAERLRGERDENAATIAALLDASKPDGFPDYATVIAELEEHEFMRVREHLCDVFGYPSEADAPEGEQPKPHEGEPHPGECIVRMGVPRARTCSRGKPACNADYEGEQP